MLNIKDANGNWVVVKEIELCEALIQNKFKIFGCNMDAIIAFREVYECKGGEDPITPASIKEVFSR